MKGAVEGCYEFTAETRADAIRMAEVHQELCEIQHMRRPNAGHLGTNGVGVHVMAMQFATVEAARVFILDSHKQWDKPMLAKIKDTDTWLLCGWCPSQ